MGGRANLDFNEGGVLALSTSIAVTGERNDRVFGDGSGVGIVTNAVGSRPIDPIYQANGDWAGVDSDDLIYPNPVQLTNDPTTARTARVLGNVEARLRMARWLRVTSRFGIDYLNMRENQFQSGKVTGTYAADAGGVAKSAYSTGSRYTIENFATLTPNWGERQALDVTLGSGLELNRGQLNFIRGEGFSSEALTQVRNATTITEFDGTHYESNIASFFARANYRLAEKYILGASVRTDASSRFGPNNRWGIFPSVSAAWVVSQEKFLRGSSFLSYLKLRGSWGLTGNQSISDYPYQGLYGSANYGSDPGVGYPTNLANPDLKWESTRQTDVGLDISFASDRINFAADYYVKNTRDLLVARPISGTSGYTFVNDNVGSMQNKGFELSLTTVNIDSKRAGGLRWTTSLNLSANRNKVTALYHDEPFTDGYQNINRVEVGQPIGAFYTIHFEGVDPETGDAIYTDVNGDGTIDAADRMIVGSPHPDYIGGLSTNISIKGFDISGLVQFSQGAEMFNAMRRYSGNGGYYTDNQFRDQLARWQKPGDVTNVPRASYDGTSNAYIVSDRWMEDGSYWRLQNVTVGYTLSPKAARSLGFQTARFYVAGNNLFTSTKFKGFSPEANTRSTANIALGTEFYTYPLARSFTFGVQTSW
jgi:TonB-linked SusC/RagA family outer membrane protein